MITERHTYPDGTMVGWDTDAANGEGDWVPLDETAEQGSFVGNVARGAVRSLDEIGQGVRSLVNPDDRLIQLQGQQLEQQRQAASRSAPWAEGIGNVVPDVAAGIGVGAATGGLGLAAMLGTEALLGGALGAVRPGSVEERAGRAAIGAGFGVGGAALGTAAQAGIGSALKLFGLVEGRTMSRVAAEAENAGAIIQSRAAAAAEQQQQLAAPSGRSVGAAETPEEALQRPAGEALEGRVLEESEQAGAENLSSGFTKKLDRAIQLGWKPTIGQGTRAGSTARLGAAVREYAPFGDVAEQARTAGNQALLVKHTAKALGDDAWEDVSRLDNSYLAFQEARIGWEFEAVQRRLPAIDSKAYSDELKGISQVQGPFGKTGAQKLVNDAIENLQTRPVMSGEEVMQTRQWLSQQMAQYFRNGETANGEVLMQAINKLDNVLERTLKREKYKGDLADKWTEARRQWQILSMVEHGASVSGTGDINPTTLMRQMRKQKSSGGFGREGPADKGSAASELFDLAEVAVDAQSHVPATGVRNLIKWGLQNPVGRLGAVAGAGGATAGGIGSIWD